MTPSLLQRRILFTALCLTLSTAAMAQERGQVGISLKAQTAPQIGLQWQASERIAVRGSAFIQGGGENAVDFFDSFIVSFYPSYRWPVDVGLNTYVGPDLTYSKFTDQWFLGAIWGARYHVHERFDVFGEFGLSFDIDNHTDAMQMFNTGAGIVFYLNR